MPRFKQITDILGMIGRKESIRNLGIIAHIDHGKTTLTDSLLAGTGLLSPKVAGSVRVLDYLEEEQKRGITIKTANISLLYKTAESSFIINLVDTPGHVDFTGKVTRALRTMDGAVVIVDAVEEIMAQTELLLRQALEERVRPVLFINKVDRLINELKLNEKQIQKKFTRIISVFNDLIEIHGESPFKEKWKANPAEGNVVFGSALHRWGFTLDLMRKKNIKFSSIIDAYKNGAYEKLNNQFPLHAAVLAMTIRHVPNPFEAQKYRLEKIWKGNLASNLGKALRSCDDKGPAVMCVTNVQVTTNGGLIATGRMFSGTLKAGDKLYLVNAKTQLLIQQIFVYMGAFREPVTQIVAGNIVAFSGGLETIKAGETLVDVKHKESMVPFEGVKYLSEPVVTVTVEPKNPKKLPKLLKSMEQLVTEDPNLAISVNRDTGEYLLNGMGELHLEIAVKHLEDIMGGVELAISSPRVVYREKPVTRGVVAAAMSPNKRNVFTVQVEPLDEERIDVLEQEVSVSRSGEKVLAVDQYENMLVNCTAKPELLQVLDFVMSGFRFACRAGPLCGEPMRRVRVNLINFQLSENSKDQSPVEVMRGVGKAIFGSFLTTRPVLLEPVYKTVVSFSAESASECSKIISRRRGKISMFEEKGAFVAISGFIPVAETFGFSEELRSATSGRAFWQSMFDHWEKIPKKLENEMIAEVRKRKGLPLELPKSEMFLEKTP